VSSKFRRISRTVISATSFVAGALLLWREVPKSPILGGSSVAGMALALWWLRRRERAHLGGREPGFAGQDLLIGAMLVGGLWLGLYAVFSLGDVGTAVGRATSIPLGPDGGSLSIGSVLGIGALSTIGVTLALVPFRRMPRKRRDVRETSLAGRISGPREVVPSPVSSEVVREERR
jgi:hypothetical protein